MAKKIVRIVKRPTRYGMPASTIKYWQDQARTLWRYHAIVSGVRTFNALNLSFADPREIAHSAIAIASVTRSEYVRGLLTAVSGAELSHVVATIESKSFARLTSQRFTDSIQYVS